MRNMFQGNICENVIQRLETLTPDAKPLWGSMTANKLLAHLIDSMQVTFGEKNDLVYRSNFLGTRLGRSLALCFPIPRGKIKAPDAFHETVPGVFDEDKACVVEYVKRFNQGSDREWGVSPIFGDLSPKQWARLNWAHFDHHLKQFSV